MPPISRRSAVAMLGAVPMLACTGATGVPATGAPQALEAVFGSPVRGVIALPGQRCRLDAPLVASRSDVTVRGVAGRTVLAIGSSPIILSLGDSSDVVFEDIAFESGFVSASELIYGLLTAVDVYLRRVRFVRCTFSVPKAAINAIHLVLDHRGAAESVHFEDCTILAAGRMGLEVQNHGNDDGRYHDIRWLGGRIADTGLRSAMGMGLSLSGYGSDCAIDTLFENNRFAAIEGVGVSTSMFTARFGRQGRAVDILSFTGDRPMHDNVIRDCRTSARANGNILLRGQRGLRMSGNDFDLAGGVLCRDINGSVVTADRYRTASTSSLFVEGRSADNSWTGCTFDNGASAGAFSTLRFLGPGTRNNRVIDSRLVRGRGGVDADNLSGASRNTVAAVDRPGATRAILG